MTASLPFGTKQDFCYGQHQTDNSTKKKKNLTSSVFARRISNMIKTGLKYIGSRGRRRERYLLTAT